MSVDIHGHSDIRVEDALHGGRFAPNIIIDDDSRLGRVTRGSRGYEPRPWRSDEPALEASGGDGARCSIEIERGHEPHRKRIGWCVVDVLAPEKPAVHGDPVGGRGEATVITAAESCRHRRADCGLRRQSAHRGELC